MREYETVEADLAGRIATCEVLVDGRPLDVHERTAIVKALLDRARWMAADITSGEKGRKGRAK